jgi:hypothetical protein
MCGSTISMVNIKNIQRLYLRDDKISNKGIKKLMKMNFCNLNGISLANLDITSDCLKLVYKPGPRLTKCGILEQ